MKITTKQPLPRKPVLVVRDVARLNMMVRPRPKKNEYTELVPDTTEG